VTELSRGVVHIRRVTDDPLRINVLLFDITALEFDLKTGLGDGWLSGRTRTSYMVRQNKALAGVNGDLFSGYGDPQGLTIVDSRVVIPPKHRATFAWTHDREPFIGYFTDNWTWDAEIVAEGGERAPLLELNRACTPDNICLYNEFEQVVPTYAGSVKVFLEPDGRVFRITEENQLPIPEGGLVLLGTGDGAEWLLDTLDIGDMVRIIVRTNHPLTDYAQAISGGPIILQEGVFVEDCLCKLRDCREVDADSLPSSGGEDPLCEDFDTDWKVRHYDWVYMPRTGVGYDHQKQTLIVAVVDGYQRGYSRGMRQVEFASLLREFGAYTAMELDGGGSTTMVLDGEVMNHPSDDTGERYVANALLFFWTDFGERD
jgi:hypothetical protein